MDFQDKAEAKWFNCKSQSQVSYQRIQTKIWFRYFEVFAIVGRHEIIRLEIIIGANKNWSLMHLDVKSAFLNGPLEEEVYKPQSP